MERPDFASRNQNNIFVDFSCLLRLYATARRAASIRSAKTPSACPILAPLVRGHRLLLLTFCSLLVRLQRDRAGGGNARLGLTLLRDLTGPSATEFECRVDGKLSKYGVSRGNRERSTSSGERPLLQDVAIS